MHLWGLHIFDALIIIGYFVALIAIGVVVSYRIKNEEDFLMGGRRLGTLLQTFMNFGMATGSDVPVGASRETFRQGMAGIWNHLFALFITPFLWFTTVWQRRLRISSMGELFRLRYESRPLETLYALIGIFYLVANMSLSMVTVQKTVQILMPKDAKQLTVAEARMIGNFERLSQLKDILRERDLTAPEKQEYEALRTLDSKGEVKSSISAVDTTVFLLALSLVVLFYTVAGGMLAAAITDAFQGVLLIVLSILLLPFGLIKTGGFAGLHAKVPDSFFNLFGTIATSEYPWYYVVSLVLVGLIVYESSPQNPQVMGSARDEEASRVGRINGIMMKRLAVVLWGFCGAIGFALYRNDISDPDMLWGYMSRQLLGPGLIGLMVVCLLAAMQSTASSLLVSSSALFTKTIYEPLFPNRPQRELVFVNRFFTVFILAISVLITLYFQDFLRVFKFLLSIGLVFGPPFWMAILWRRATAKSIWTAVLYSAVCTAWLGNFGADIGLFSKSAYFCQLTNPKTIAVSVGATEADVAAGRARTLDQIIHKEIAVEPKGIFFENIVRQNPHEPGSAQIGTGRFRVSLLFPALLGIDLKQMSVGDLNAFGFFLDVVIPFLLIIAVSYLTRQNDKRALDQFYGRLHTPVIGTPEDDAREMAMTREQPLRFKNNKIWPNSNFELLKPTPRDLWGFAAISGLVVVVILFLYLLTILGK